MRLLPAVQGASYYIDAHLYVSAKKNGHSAAAVGLNRPISTHYPADR
jgi:hypothetical protein